MFDEIFLKQRDLFNNMKDKQMLIDYIVYNVDLILVKLINLYRDYDYAEADRTSLKGKVYSVLGDFSYLLPLTFTNNYIDDIIYLKKVNSLPYHDVIVPYNTSINNKHFFRYVLFTICMTTTSNHDILEDIKFIMYSKTNGNRDDNEVCTPFIYYCRKNSIERMTTLFHSNSTNNIFNTTCYFTTCKNCIMSRRINNGLRQECNPCYLIRNKGLYLHDIMKSFYYAFSCGLLLAIITNENRIRSDLKKLNLRDGNKAKCFKRSANEYLNYCVNKRKGLIYSLREEIIKTAIVDIFGDAQTAKFFSGINTLNNYIVKSEKRYKDGI